MEEEHIRQVRTHLVEDESALFVELLDETPLEHNELASLLERMQERGYVEAESLFRDGTRYVRYYPTGGIEDADLNRLLR